MRSRAPLLALGLVLALTLLGFATLYRLRLAQGDIFPAYSSLRADPLGLRALHDSMAALPGWRVSRWRQPIETLVSAPPRTIVLAGLTEAQWAQVTPVEFAALDAAVRGGSRLLIAFRAIDADNAAEEEKAKKAADAKLEKRKSAAEKAKQEAAKKPVPVLRDRDATPSAGEDGKNRFVDLGKLWGVTLKRHPALGSARRSRVVQAELPDELRWESDLYFEIAQGMPWQEIYRRRAEPVLVELSHGLGSIVLAGDSYPLSNEALQRDRSPALLAWLAGPRARIEFVESHLGVIEEPGVAALAKRYGLGGAFFTLLVLAALFVWRRMALFVPPVDEADALMLAYNQTAGLEALLRRSVSPGELIATSVAEWKRTARPSDIARVEAALAVAPKDAAPATVHNVLVQTLRRR